MKWFVIGTVAITVILLGGIIAFGPKTSVTLGSELQPDQWQEVITAPTHSLGDPASPVVIAEFADLQCPACAAANPALKAYLESAEGVHFVWRHFPLGQHEFAEDAARAADAIGKQGKFFEFADLLFRKQGEWTKVQEPAVQFEQYVRELGLDADAYKAEFEAVHLEAIRSDAALGEKIGVNSTPTIFINGKKLNSFPRSVSEWQAVVKQYQDQQAVQGQVE